MKFFSFSEAIIEVKDGKKFTRLAWTGDFIFLVPGSTFQVNRKPLLGIYPEGTEVTYHAHIDIVREDGVVMPWTPTQNDILTDDWIWVV